MMQACIFLFSNCYSIARCLYKGLFLALYGWYTWVSGIVYCSRIDLAPFLVPIGFFKNLGKPPPLLHFSPANPFFNPYSLKYQNALNVKNTAPHFVTLKLIMQLEQISRSTASRYINLAAQHYDKKEHQRLSFQEYADYYGWDHCTALRRLGFDCEPQKLTAA